MTSQLFLMKYFTMSFNWCWKHRVENASFVNNDFDVNSNFSVVVGNSLEELQLRGKIYFLALALCLAVAFPITLAIYAANPDIEIFVAFAPLLAAFSLMVLFGRLGHSLLVWALTIAASSPVITFVVLLALQIRGTLEANWFVVHIPMWVLYSAVLFGPLVGVVIGRPGWVCI